MSCTKKKNDDSELDEFPIAKELNNVFVELNRKVKDPYDPEKFYNDFININNDWKTKNGISADALDFLNTIYEYLFEDLLGKTGPLSCDKDIFYTKCIFKFSNTSKEGYTFCFHCQKNVVEDSNIFESISLSNEMQINPHCAQGSILSWPDVLIIANMTGNDATSSPLLKVMLPLEYTIEKNDMFKDSATYLFCSMIFHSPGHYTSSVFKENNGIFKFFDGIKIIDVNPNDSLSFNNNKISSYLTLNGNIYRGRIYFFKKKKIDLKKDLLKEKLEALNSSLKNLHDRLQKLSKSLNDLSIKLKT